MQTIQGYYELIPGDIDVFFKPFNPQKNIYELYVTAANNKFMPLINYSIGDLVMINPDSLPLVQSNPKEVMLDSIVGRAKQVLFSDKNKPLTLYEIDEFLFSVNPNILLYSIKKIPPQKINKHSIELDYFTGENTKISSEQENQIVDYFKSKLNANTQINLVRSIAPSPSGKYQLIS